MADEGHRRHFVLANAALDRAARMDWYDADFLILFEAGRVLLRHTSPGRVDEFVAAFASLRTDPGFTARHERGFLPPDAQRELRRTIAEIRAEQFEQHEAGMFGRTVIHDMPELDPLHRDLAGWVSEAAGEEVVPAYSFLSLYTRDGALAPHLDGPISKWTVDICIDSNVDWPIHFSKVVDWPTCAGGASPALPQPGDPALGFRAISLEPGDAALFSGSAQWHYRDPMPDPRHGFCHLLFLHYHPAGAENLVDPARWGRHFGLPELDVLHCAFRIAFKRT